MLDLVRPAERTDSRDVFEFSPLRTLELVLPELLLRSLFILSIEFMLSDLKEELRTLPALLALLPELLDVLPALLETRPLDEDRVELL